MVRFLSVAAIITIAVGTGTAQAQVRQLRPLPVPNYSIIGPVGEGRSASTTAINPDFRDDPSLPAAALTGIAGTGPTGSFNPTSGTMGNPGFR